MCCFTNDEFDYKPTEIKNLLDKMHANESTCTIDDLYKEILDLEVEWNISITNEAVNNICFEPASYPVVWTWNQEEWNTWDCFNYES